jgi:tetratricopeptide (TPR) repeat protein
MKPLAPTLHAAACTVLVVLGACQSAGEPSAQLALEAVPEPGPAPVPATSGPTEGAGLSEAQRRAIAAIEQGDLGVAREVIEAALVAPLVDDARLLLERQAAGEALAVLEQARELAPAQREPQLLYAEASLRVGLALGEPERIATARGLFERFPASPAACLGASRAARAERHHRPALDHARRAMDLLALGAEIDGPLGESPERTSAEAHFNAWLEAQRGAAPDAATLLAETEDALSTLMASEPGDPWPWKRLSELYLEVGRAHDARDAAERGLDRAPTDGELAHLLARAAVAVNGSQGLMNRFALLRQKHPQAPLAYWYPAQEGFRRAVAGEVEQPIEELRKAELRFHQCRDLDPGLAEACLAYEALCRGAVGWRLLGEKNLVGARKAFESMEEVLPDGMLQSLDERVPSGVEGLRSVALAHEAEGNDAAAGRVWEALSAYEPASLEFARLAGTAHREAALGLIEDAQLLERAAAGELERPRLERARELARVEAANEGKDGERARFRSAAAQKRERAAGLFAEAHAAFLRASALAPDDLRALNDIAEIAVYHTGSDLERAEDYLLRCVRLGGEQLQQAGLSPERHFELETAWGDAYQHLGVLYLEHKHEPEQARGYFARALEIGPVPRPRITDYMDRTYDHRRP